MNMNQAARRVDVTDLQVQSFVEPQAHRIDGPEVDEHSLSGGLRDQRVNLSDGEDFGERVDVLQFEHFDDVPVSLAGVGKEEFHTGEGNAERPVSKPTVDF